MQDWIELLIAFVLGFFMKTLMGTVCQSRLVEPAEQSSGLTRGAGAGELRKNKRAYAEAIKYGAVPCGNNGSSLCMLD